MFEKLTYRKLKNNIIKGTDRIDRIENLLVDGMPDVNICVNGRESWIEIKTPVEPVRRTTKVFKSSHALSMDQQNWFLRQSQAYGNGFVLIETNKRLLMISGRRADHINDATMNALINMSCWHAEKPEREEDWKRLRHLLMIL